MPTIAMHLASFGAILAHAHAYTTGAGTRMPHACTPDVRMVAATATTSPDISAVKSKILQIAALTDRGQRLNTLIAPTYQEKRTEMTALLDELAAAQSSADAVTESALEGERELVFSEVELFRSSPFFLAIEEALNNSPNIPTLGRWLGLTDPTKKAELFFKLHQLQVLSWGTSTVGRIAQRLDFAEATLESTFDTTIFGLTVIPIVGWFKLLPTFGGRVVTEADRLAFDEETRTLSMELQRTRVVTAPGVPRIPLVDGLLMERWYPVNSVWKLLPWNGGPFDGRSPTCRMEGSTSTRRCASAARVALLCLHAADVACADPVVSA